MKCPRCQVENRPQAKFCEECGASLARTCANCGSPLTATAKFCAECGQAAASATAVSERFVSPQAYTPKHLAERILSSKSALEGERKQVTVLFADLKGSMELLADRDPEDARKLLDPVLERMMEAVHRYEGTVNQVMGDGIMALFGAPLAHEDHAVRACYAALAMQSTIHAYSEHAQRTQGLAIWIRVGLNSGEVVVRTIGGDLHMDYTAVGQTTHLAARMEQLAAPGSTLLSAATLELVEGFVSVKPRGSMPVKGMTEPVEVYELIGAGAARSRLQAAAARGLTKFVGRNAELWQLHQALERAQTGHELHDALAMADRCHQQGSRSWALYLLGNLRATGSADEKDLARTAYRDGRDLAKQLGMRPLESLCHLGLAMLVDGRKQERWEHIEAATRMFREMDMQSWLEKAEAALHALA
jgi:class 3 adenylate cyclase